MDSKQLYVWVEKHQKRIQWFVMPLLLLLVAGVYVLVYMTGGIKYVYSHSMYIPILLSGMAFGIRGGVIIGLLAGLVLGPFMPLEVATGEQQTTLGWLYRSGFFTLIGFLCGFARDSVKSYLRYIKWLSRHDLASGLPNRNALLEQLAQKPTDQSDSSVTPVLAVISIENERELLSTFGITVIDQAIAQLIQRLQKKESQILAIYRISTVQLGVLINHAGNVEGERFFDQLSTSFREPILFAGIPIHLDVRMGFVELTGAQVPPENYLQQAECALAEACDKGGDYLCFTPAISTASRENLVMLGELKDALTTKQLSLFYQPKVDISTGAVHGVEALIRWNHPQRGSIPPEVFIPRAEESTLINQITYFALNQAMQQTVQWQRSGINIPIAVNISARNLLQSDFSSVVFLLLEHHGLTGEQLELEVTERALMLDAQRAIVELNKLADAKIALSIDDFGTGYSSLQYLHRLPVSFLKIDQSFVRRLPSDKSAVSIVETAVSMAHKMNIKTIAEGVENREIYDFLKSLGCDIAQGYKISRPLPGEEYAKWHMQNNAFFK